MTATPAPTPETTPEQSQSSATNTPEPTPIITPTGTPTVEPTAQPTEITTPTPTPETGSTGTPSPSIEPTAEPTVEPTLEISPTSEPTTSATPSESTEQPKETSPPTNSSDNSNASTNTTSSPTSTIEPSPSPEINESLGEKGELKTTILKNIESQTLDLDGVNPDGSAKLSTDKADYAPTDAAIITGTGFNQNTTYELTVSSTDNPATSTTVTITTDSAGSFVYAYQLDGVYRAKYRVDIRNGDTIVGTTTFTDSIPSGCQIDSSGANDVPNQKDLTKMCADYSGLPSSEIIKWNWDDTSFSGGNTGDACALFDTNGNGNANYALCVQVGNSPATYITKFLYSCDDSSATNCLGNIAHTPSSGTTCSSSIKNTDPFPGPGTKNTGDYYPNDTEANCIVNLTDVGGGAANLTDVCSYPSASTPSNASDCILFKTKAGKLTITKILSPTNDSGLFNLQIDGVTANGGANATNGTTTLTEEVSEGNHTVGETAVTGTNLSDYSSSIGCKDSHGTGNVVTTSTGGNPWTLNVADGSDVLCTITNSKNATCGDGKINQTSEQCDNGTQNGLVCTPPYGTNGRPASCSYCDTSCHTVTLTDGYCGDNIVNDASEQCDGTAGVPANYTCSSTCTLIRNTGNVTFVKTVDYGPGAPSDWTFSVTDGVGGLVGDTYASGHTYTFDTGTYHVGETTTLGGYSFYGATGICSVNPTNGRVDMNVTTAGGTCTITNHRDMGSVLLHKNIDINGDGDWADTNETSDTFADSNGFSYNFYGGARSYGVSLTGIPTTTSYASYPISENMPDTYHFSGWFNTNETGRSCANPNGTSMPTALVVNKNATTEITLCNTRNTGTLQVLKDVDLNGDGDYTDPGETGVTDWQWQYNNGSDHATGDTLTVPTGNYALSETDKPGFHMERLSCIGGTLNLSTVTVGTGANVVCTFGNARDVGSVKVTKIIDADGDLTTTDDQTPGNNWQFGITGTSTDTNTATSQYTGTNGTTTFTPVKTGTYNIGETAQDGYTLISASCSSGSRDGDTIYGVQVTRGNETICTFYNTPNGTIHGYKWNDEDQSGGPSADSTEPLLSGWTIDLYRWNGEGFDTEPMSSMTTSDGTAHFGWYWFEHLFPGTYKVCEEPKTGWTQTFPVNQTDNCHIVNLPDDNSYDFPTGENYVSGPEYNFGNRFVTPELQISKTNNAVGDQAPGASVTYTIHLKVLKNSAYNVKVTDLVPQGFAFTGTWTATRNGNPMSITAPSYHSPGTWDLGNLEKDDDIVLTMNTTVSNDQKPGLYKDLAYAYGCEGDSTCAITDEQAVVAQAVSPGNLDSNFVGTDVNIVTNQQESKTLSVVTEKTEEGSVLGASTELPSTGADTGWIIFAVALIITGSGMVIVGRIQRRRYHA